MLHKNTNSFGRKNKSLRKIQKKKKKLKKSNSNIIKKIFLLWQIIVFAANEKKNKKYFLTFSFKKLLWSLEEMKTFCDTVFREFLEQQNKCSRNKGIVGCMCVCVSVQIKKLKWFYGSFLAVTWEENFKCLLVLLNVKKISIFFFPFIPVDDAEADGNAAWNACRCYCCFNTGYLLKYATEYENKIKQTERERERDSDLLVGKKNNFFATENWK